MIAGVSVLFPADVVTAVGLGRGRLRRKKEAKDSSLFGRRVEDFGTLDKAQEFKLRDHVVALAFLQPCGRSQPGHRSEAFRFSRCISHFKQHPAYTHLPGP